MELSGELTGLGDLLLESFRSGLILSCFAGTVRAETGIFPAGKGGHRARRRPAHAQSAAPELNFQFGRQQRAPGRSYCRSSGVKFPLSYRK